MLFRHTKRKSVRFQKLIQQHKSFVEHPYLPLCAVLLVAFFVRVLLGFGSTGILWPDSFAYFRSAALMAKHLNFTWHEIYRTPLYPFFMSPFLAFGQSVTAGDLIIYAQRGLGLASILIFYRYARHVFGASTAFYAALLFSIHTLQLYYETVIQTEVLFVFLLCACLWQSVRLFENPRVLEAMRLGLVLGLLTLTRPLGQYALVVFLFALACQYPKPRLLAKLAAGVILSFALVLIPWMLVNKSTYKFFGVSQDIGLNLFHRVIDIEGLEPVKESKFPKVHYIWTRVKHRAPSSYFSVYHQLRRERVSARRADIMLKTVALETLAQYPKHKFAWTSLKIFTQLFVSARNSVHFCGSDTGPYLCVPSTRGQRTTVFPNSPKNLFPPAQKAIRKFFSLATLPMWLISPLALLGALYLIKNRGLFNPHLALSIGLIAVFTSMAAIINVAEDRFRLPIDPLLFCLATTTVITICKRLVAKHLHEQN
jgi:4-amino-4-deoxy-L-arabinose transferase-like glycosyltransferase